MNIDNYQFEEFTDFKGKFDAKITVGKSGFGFTSGLINKYKLDEFKALKIYFDKSQNAIAFQFFKEHEAGTIKFKKRGGGGGYLGARSFFGKYSIKPEDYAGKYAPKEIKQEQMGTLLVIELKKKQEQKVNTEGTEDTNKQQI